MFKTHYHVSAHVWNAKWRQGYALSARSDDNKKMESLVGNTQGDYIFFNFSAVKFIA